MAKKTVTKTKTKKKRWVSVLAPKLFNNAPMGESYVTEPGVLVGRRLSVNLMNITGEAKKQNVTVQFQVQEIKENTAHTFATGFELSNSAVKRYIRRGKDKVDDSFTVKTSDGMSVRIKPMAVTSSNTSNSVLTKMRLEARKLLKEECVKLPFNNLIESILRFELQKKVKLTLSKIYPVKNVEIRKLKLLEKDKAPEEYTHRPKVEKKFDKRPTEQSEVGDKKTEAAKIDDKKETKEEKKETKVEKEVKTEKKETKAEKKEKTEKKAAKKE